MAHGIDHVGKHVRHAFYVARENPAVERWKSIFGYIQDGAVESFIKCIYRKQHSKTKPEAIQQNCFSVRKLLKGSLLNLLNVFTLSKTQSLSDRAGTKANRDPPAQDDAESSRWNEVELFGYQSIVAHAAAFSKRCLEYLLSDEGGCDPNIRSSGAKDQTPLFSARGECIATLLAHGADPYARNVDGDTAFTAAVKRRDYEQAIDYLRYGLDPGAADTAGYTALYVAVAQQESFDQEPFWKEFFETFCLRQPFEIPTLLNKRCVEGTTCLHAAAAAKKVALVRKFLFWGADPFLKDDHGNIPKLEVEWKEDIDKNPLLGSTLAATKKEGEIDLTNRDVIIIKSDNNDSHPNKYATSNVESHSKETFIGDERRGESTSDQTKRSFQSLSESFHAGILETHAEDRGGAAKTERSEDEQHKPGHGNSVFAVKSEKSRRTKVDASMPALNTNATSSRDIGHLSGSMPPRSLRSSEIIGGEASSTEESSSEDEDANEGSTRSTQAKVLTAAKEKINQKIQVVDDDYAQLTAEAQGLNEEFQCLKNENVNLETKLASKLASFGDVPLLKAQTGSLNVVQYTSSLLVLNKAYDEYQKTRDVATGKEASARAQLEMRRDKLRGCQIAFRNFLYKVAKNSRMSRTSKPIPDLIIQQLLRLVEEKTAIIRQSRETITTLKHELNILQADASANHSQGQFHVMDFEQLKIENQALNEKIVERNEEIRKLQSIVVSAVQFNTHWREKIHFLIHENVKATQELAKLDTELATQRELINKSKKERDEYRAENNKLRQQTDMINSEVLTQDWEVRQQKKQELKLELAKLQRTFKDMCLEKDTLFRGRKNQAAA